MGRRTLIGISAAVVLLLFGALPVVRRFVAPTPPEFAQRHINPPASWADPDCERFRRSVRTTVGKPDLRLRLNVSHLSADEVAVYAAVLHLWNSGVRPLNVANRTFPLDAVSPDSSCECLGNLDIQNLASASHSFHFLSRDVFPERSIRLVDGNRQRTAIHANDPLNGMAVGKSVKKAVNDALRSASSRSQRSLSTKTTARRW